MSLPVPPSHLLLPGQAEGAGGGRIKATPGDFRVDEIPAYEPSGEGDFLYLRVEKEDVSGGELVRQVSRRLGVPAREVGVAGSKDRRAVTAQWVSVPARGAREPARLAGTVGETGRLAVLEVSRHTNKLRTGHLRANRFEIRVRERDATLDAGVKTAIDAIAERGFANVFGPQRFGGGSTLALGRRALSGGVIRDRRDRRLGVSAVQAWVFNRWLAARIDAGLAEQALAGDLLKRRDTGGLFVCEDAEADTARLAAGELVLTGPLPGSKLRAATGAPGEIEAAAIRAAGVEPEAFARAGKIARGTRRAALAWPIEASCAREDDAVVLRFVLPRGAYATVLLATLLGPGLHEGAAALGP